MWRWILGIAIVVVAGIGAWANQFFRPATISITNSTGMPVEFALRYRLSSDEAVVTEWAKVAAGATSTRSVTFRGVEPNFAVVGASEADTDALRVIYESYQPATLKTSASSTVPTKDRQLFVWDDPGADSFSVSAARPGEEQPYSSSSSLRFRDLDGEGPKGRDFAFEFTPDNAAFVQAAALHVVNATPFSVQLVVARRATDKDFHTFGWLTVDAGGKWSTAQVFRGVTPDFAVFAQSSGEDADIVQYCYESQIGSDGPFQITWDDASGPELYVTNQPLDVVQLQGASLPPGARWATFARPSYRDSEKHIYIHKLQPPAGFSWLQDQRVDADVLAAQCGEASMAREVLKRQRMWKEWGEASLRPYSLGITVDPKDAFDEPGIMIVDASPTLPSGHAMHFQAGDVIEWLGRRRIYSHNDLYGALHEHAEDRARGIGEAIPFVVRRGDTLLHGNTSYWFEKEWWRRSSSISISETGAFVSGVIDGVTIGFGPRAQATFDAAGTIGMNALKWAWSQIDEEYHPSYEELDDWDEKTWYYVQIRGMQRQWFPEARQAGDVVGAFTSVPRGILKVAGGKALRRFAGSMVGSISFEVVEGLVWSEIADPAVVRTAEERRRAITIQIGVSVVGGGIAGRFSRVVP